jgi:hypothetical protein
LLAVVGKLSVVISSTIPVPPNTGKSAIKMSLPKTYKALQQKEKGKPFEMIDVDLEEPKAGYLVVKVLACGGEPRSQLKLRDSRF